MPTTPFVGYSWVQETGEAELAQRINADHRFRYVDEIVAEAEADTVDALVAWGDRHGLDAVGAFPGLLFVVRRAGCFVVKLLTLSVVPPFFSAADFATIQVLGLSPLSFRFCHMLDPTPLFAWLPVTHFCGSIGSHVAQPTYGMVGPVDDLPVLGPTHNATW